MKPFTLWLPPVRMDRYGKLELVTGLAVMPFDYCGHVFHVYYGHDRALIREGRMYFIS